MSTCTCGHLGNRHDILNRCCDCECRRYSTPLAATERTTTMPTNDNLPRVIDLADAQVGDLIEATFRDDPDYLTIRRVKSVEENYVHLFREAHPWPIIRNPHKEFRRFRLLDRPEPPKPSLPTEPGTVITGKLDGLGVMLVRRRDGWTGMDVAGDWRICHSPDRITDWTVVYDPTAPKADDGLRERVERLVEDFESLPHSTSTGRYIAHNLRTALTETSADA